MRADHEHFRADHALGVFRTTGPAHLWWRCAMARPWSRASPSRTTPGSERCDRHIVGAAERVGGRAAVGRHRQRLIVDQHSNVPGAAELGGGPDQLPGREELVPCGQRLEPAGTAIVMVLRSWPAMTSTGRAGSELRNPASTSRAVGPAVSAARASAIDRPVRGTATRCPSRTRKTLDDAGDLRGRWHGRSRRARQHSLRLALCRHAASRRQCECDAGGSGTCPPSTG